MRRDLIPALLALMLVPLTVVSVLRLMPEPPPSVLAFPKPTYRVAVAVGAAMRSELTSASRPLNSSFSQDMRFLRKNGKFPSFDEIQLGEDDPAFWIGLGGAAPSLMRLRDAKFAAVAHDGRKVQATIKADPFGEGSVVDFHGDHEIARLLSRKIAENLGRPTHPRGSPEDRTDLQAFFDASQGAVGGTPSAATSPPVLAAEPKAGGAELDAGTEPR